jgi:hypothetical protein
MTRISRRQFIGYGTVLAGASLAGCAPLQILFNLYPEKYDVDKKFTGNILRLFAESIIPGMLAKEGECTNILCDPYYSFDRYSGFFAFDLCRRSRDLFKIAHFNHLNESQRELVIKDGLNSSSLISKLYGAAIFMTQVSFYSNIYDDEQGCELIGFEGGYFIPDEEEISYKAEKYYSMFEITSDGNYS